MEPKELKTWTEQDFPVIEDYYSKIKIGEGKNIVSFFNRLQAKGVKAESFAKWLLEAESCNYLSISDKVIEFVKGSQSSIKIIPNEIFERINQADWFNLLNTLEVTTENNLEVEVESEFNIITQENKQQVKPFDIASVDIETKTLSILGIIRKLEYNEINLDTDFQRSQNLWDKTRQSRLIESLLVKFPIPVFYFDVSQEDNWLVIDGLQRLSTLKNFVVDGSLTLENLEFLTEEPYNFNGKLFKQLPRDFQRRIEDTQIITYQIRKSTPQEVKFNLFKRINTGGLVLSAAEIRHALNQGSVSNLIKELASMPSFLFATGNAISDKRMEDRDFIARFLAFYLIDFSNYGKTADNVSYRADLDGFINQSLDILKTRLLENPGYQNVVKTDFEKAMQTAFSIFGEYAFRKQTSFKYGIRKKPINKALFEVLSSFLARCTNQELSNFEGRKDAIKAKFAGKMQQTSFYDSFTVGTGETRRVNERHKGLIAIFNFENQ